MDIEKAVRNLEKNNIGVIRFKTKDEAADYLRQNLKKGANIMVGGSVTVSETGIMSLIESKDYNYISRFGMGLSEEDRTNIFKSAIGVDYYFCSANAITEDGELINVDGMGNRVTALSFGPKKVFVVAGTNKIVKDQAEGFLRIKKIAAPKNTVRLKLDTPCAKLGHCIALEKSDCPKMTDGCDSKYRICRHYVVTGKQNDQKRITVLLIDENLGY